MTVAEGTGQRRYRHLAISTELEVKTPVPL